MRVTCVRPRKATSWPVMDKWAGEFVEGAMHLPAQRIEFRVHAEDLMFKILNSL